MTKDVEEMTLREYVAHSLGCGVEDVTGATLEGGKIRATLAWGRCMTFDLPPAPAEVEVVAEAAAVAVEAPAVDLPPVPDAPATKKAATKKKG